jgi:hypothetical protein
MIFLSINSLRTCFTSAAIFSSSSGTPFLSHHPDEDDDDESDEAEELLTVEFELDDELDELSSLSRANSSPSVLASPAAPS